MDKKRHDIGQKEGQKKKQDQMKAPEADPSRREAPRRHEDAPSRNPAPTRPARESDPSGVRRDRDIENPDDRDRDDG